MKLNQIHIRDPYVLLVDGKYYLYGSRGGETWGKCTGLDVYVSDDMEDWSDPIEVFTRPEDFWADMNFWAPEVHIYKDAYYMFVSFKSETRCRGTQILKADSPLGPFRVHSDGPVTPADWECLDGTLYVNNGKPYMVFCHEWVQVFDGEICALPLSDDLCEAAGEPVLLFKASEPAWADGRIECAAESTKVRGYVTDGPFLYQSAEGKLMMIWSSLAQGDYYEAVAYSESGDLLGPWKHEDKLLFDKDGGHGMLFRTKEDDLKLILHRPNVRPNERPKILDVGEEDGSLFLK